VPEDDVDLYSSGEESMDRWTVETWRLYEVTRNVETDVTFTRGRQIRAAAAAAVDTSRGRLLLSFITPTGSRTVKKVKFSHTRYRALGPELIPVYRQSACR